MDIVTCSNYFDLNQTVALRRELGKTIDLFGNIQRNFRVSCPFRLYKIYQCWINQENLSHVLDRVDYESKTQTLLNLLLPGGSSQKVFLR